MLVKQRTIARHASIIAALLASAACSDPASPDATLVENEPAMSVQWAGNPELGKTLAAIRAATAQFHDEAVALAAGYGYPPVAFCESSSTGAMGIHHGNFALLGIVPGAVPPTGTDAEIDLLRPEVLLYEPQADGTRKLVGVEYVVYRAAWDAVNSEPPTLLGVPFDERFGSNTHGHAEHYELHVWLWRNNPLGMFAPYNPKVSC